MKKQLLISLKMLIIMTILLGVIYPLLITGVAQLAFPNKANGSLVKVNGALRGSKLIGQKTDASIYFHSRPSATDYNTLASGASNLGLTNKKLYDSVQARKQKIIEENNLPQGAVIPSEMLFASASGLDPHISPEAAKMQINRIAKARGFSEEQKKQLNTLINKMTEAPQFGIFGYARVNVLMLNLELDKLK
jgi:K+-transporting ATPase ATPase C chain